MTHELQSWARHFQPTWDGLKTFEFRQRKEGPFRTGDFVKLREYDPVTKIYSGRELTFQIGWIFNMGFTLVLFSLLPLEDVR